MIIIINKEKKGAIKVAEDGKPKKGFLSNAFNFCVHTGWTVGALVAGFYLGSFLDYGFMHSMTAANTGLTQLSLEFMSPVMDAVGNFFGSDTGQATMGMLEEGAKSIHRFFGIENTFTNGIVSSETLGAAGSSLSSALPTDPASVIPGFD